MIEFLVNISIVAALFFVVEVVNCLVTMVDYHL